MKRLLFLLLATIAWAADCAAQEFFNLTAAQVRIDTVLPRFGHSLTLPPDYADSIYSVAIEYPEFVDMTEGDIRRYKAIAGDTLPAMPAVDAYVGVTRKVGKLNVSFVPLVFRNGKYQKLVSFKLNVTSRPARTHAAAAKSPSRATAAAGRYAANSVLAAGSWAKIRVPSSGVYQITDELARRAGFSSAAAVRIYGYGGSRQPETLSGSYLAETDDLPEVPSCTMGGKRLFYARGPVSWDDGGSRTRNPYSDYGYYFLTEGGDPLVVDSATFVGAFYPADHDYNTIREVDDYAWYPGGRNLFESEPLATGQANAYTMQAAGQPGAGSLRVSITANAATTAEVSLNGTRLGTISIDAPGAYSEAASATKEFAISQGITATNTIDITPTGGGTVRLDYISLRTDQPKAAPALSTAQFPVPEYVYRITNQDLHAHGPADMVIVIPTSQRLRQQAERLAALHERADSLRVRIVPADEIYNEFSSGTPDATAYRRYMKMLYDRAETEADQPKFLLLFGDGAWDNRFLTPGWRNLSPDDYLICYESENSFNEIYCYVSDDFFCLLDDGEAIQSGRDESTTAYRGQPDVAVGRLPAVTEADAKGMVDKIEAYINNDNAGAWQNTIVVMGDDGDNNTHMRTADRVANQVLADHPEYSVKKIMWDAYQRETSATGNSYPDVTRLIKQYMANGALIMNYNGHGVEYCLSHEQVVVLNDFTTSVSGNLPLWVTAACDVLPFDGQEDNIGEEAVLNPNGGAIAFYGTTRTVYSSYNEQMNLAFMREMLDNEGGGRVAIGEAVRRAKEYLVTSGRDQSVNKLQFTLLGDPALKLATPTLDAVVDSINGVAVGDGTASATLGAGMSVTVKGRILSNGATATGFDGTLTATVSDAEVQVTCRLNDTSADAPDSPLTFTDRTGTVFKGSSDVSGGNFSFTFAVPKDISYSDGSGLINLYAVSDDKSLTAGGANGDFTLNGSANLRTDSVGPSIYCYLNASTFTNGGNVNPTPYFVAELSDEDGINAAGTGIGHDLQLVIDGDVSKTYTLNDYFTFDFGSYKSGTIGFSIPQLEEGLHRLQFRAWDILNNSSSAELTFNVVGGLEPGIIDVDCTQNPATTSTSFRIIHDRTGSPLDVAIDLYDLSGRHLWTHSETDTPASGELTVDWDLTIDGGRRLGTGVYIYRVRASSDGSGYASKAKKLIIINNK